MAAVILGIGLIATIAVFDAMDSHYGRARQVRDQTSFNNLVEDIENRFQLYARGLRALRNFVNVDGMSSMTRTTFESFINSQEFSTDFAGARGIGLIRYVKPEAERAFLDEKLAVDGYANFKIKQFSPHDEARFVIQYVLPREGNHEAIGLDLSSETVRKAAVLASVDRNAVTLSGPITLVQANAQGATGLLALLPIFKAGKPLSTPEERFKALLGWAYNPLVVQDAIADITVRYKAWAISIYDEESPRSNPVFDTEHAADVRPGLERTVSIQGRRWRIAATPRQDATLAVVDHEKYTAAIATFALFALIALVNCIRTRHLSKERHLSAERSRLAEIVAHASDAMLSTDIDGRIISWNASASRLFQIPEGQAKGRDVRTLLSSEPDPIYAGMRTGRDLPEEGLTVQTICKRLDGTEFPALISFFALRNDAGQLGISVRDMSDQQAFEECILELTHKLKAEVAERTSQLDQSLALQAEIHHLAMHDPLTGLANRTLFRDRLLAAVALHHADAANSFALLALDLDRFKPVNDTYGHPIGDVLLTLIGARLRSCIRHDETVARLGGDEFAILLNPGTSKDDAIAAAKRVLDAIERPFEVDGLTLEIGVSIGIALHDEAMRLVNADDTFGLADHALYKAKRSGRGGFHVCTDLQDAKGPHSSRMAIEMREALRQGEFHLQYQPIVDCSTGRLDAFEALLRWTHPTRGSISPAEFIPVAEESDQIVVLGEWALREACIEASRWDGSINISVNVSPLQIKRPGWDDRVLAIIKETNLDASRLIIEVTESVLMTDSVQVLDRLHRLQDHGISIALDDFGTGYSSLSYLRRFRFNKLKIDKSFIRDSEDVVCAAIIRCIVRLGRQLSIQVVAEGIETERQQKLIEREGCSYAQGFYFAKPLDPKAARAFIRKSGDGQPRDPEWPDAQMLRKSA